MATLRRANIALRKVFSPDTVCVDARIISPEPETVAHFVPVASAESAVRTCPLVPTASLEAVLDPVPTARSPFASHIASVATDPPPDITISPLHSIEVELIVFMLVQDTSVSCFEFNAV